MIHIKPTKSFIFSLSLLLIISFVFSGKVFAQTTLVTLEGLVADEQGNALPGATINLKNEETGYVYSTTSRADGRYVISGILAGTYNVTAEMPGFATEVKKGLVFKVGSKLAIDFKLPLKQIEEQIEVTAEAPLVEVTKSEVSSVVERKQIEDLPLLSRNFVDLAMLKTGVVPKFGNSEEPVAANAQPRGNEEFVIDGVSNEGNLVNYIRANIPADAIQEFRVLTNQFSAEFGNSSGLVMNAITRSGTNNFKGRAYGFLRDEALDSVNYFLNHAYYQGPEIKDYKKQDYQDYRFGGVFGGPIIKDKLHFFLSYERPYHKSYTVVSSPTLPKETFPSILDNNQILVKLNYQLNEKNLFSFRYTHDKPGGKGQWAGGTVSKEVACDYFYLDDAFQGNWTYFPTNNTLNELRLQYSRADIKIDTPLPNAFTVYRPSSVTGKWDNQPQEDLEYRYQIVDNFSIFLDKHQIKFGVDFSYLHAKGFIYNFNPGTVTFWTDAPFDTADPTTYPVFFQYTKGDPNFKYPTINSGVFVQDSWRINPRLTLNLGLRWSYYYMKSLRLSNTKNFDPRIGFSYDPVGDGKTVIRGGVGKFTANILTNEAILTDWFNQLQIQYVYNPGWPDPFKPDPFGTTFYAASATEYIAEDGQVPPFTWHFTLGGQRQVMTYLSVGADLVYARGYHLIRWWDKNAVINGTGYIRPDPNKGAVWETQGSGKSDYKALYLSVQKRYSHGWALEIAYTLSQSKSDTEIEWSSPTDYTKPELEWGPSNTDARHRISINGTVDLPLGFQLSTIFYYRSGLPYDIVTGNDDNGDGQWYDYPAGKHRNAERGKDWLSLNLRVSKFINIKPVSFQVFAELFNATNRANFTSYVGNMQSTIFGKPSSADDPRLIQLGARINF